MLSQGRVFLLVLFLGIGMLGLITNVETGYAQAPSVPAKGEAPAIHQDCKETCPALDKMGLQIMKYTVLTVFLEILLTFLFKTEQVFTWLQGKTWKTPVAIGLGLLAAWGLDFHISQNVLEALQIAPSWAENNGKAYSILMNGIDGFLLAGGNHGLFRLFTKIGIHDPFERIARAAA